jgi:membrane metallo-endopeptidase-like protein 1
MFWLGYAQMWCSRFRDAALINAIATDVHSPGPFRINGPLSNAEDFAKDYNCQKGTFMNRENKCAVW